MKNNIFKIVVFACLLFSANAFSQDNKQISRPATMQENNADLSFYPNPVTGDKIYITSKTNLDTEIFIYDVLGKLVLQANVSNKELNITSVVAGVYIIKIKEGDATATRKLIVR